MSGAGAVLVVVVVVVNISLCLCSSSLNIKAFTCYPTIHLKAKDRFGAHHCISKLKSHF